MMKKILAAFFALGVIASTGIATASAAHAADFGYANRTTVTGNEAG